MQAPNPVVVGDQPVSDGKIGCQGGIPRPAGDNPEVKQQTIQSKSHHPVGAKPRITGREQVFQDACPEED